MSIYNVDDSYLHFYFCSELTPNQREQFVQSEWLRTLEIARIMVKNQDDFSNEEFDIYVTSQFDLLPMLRLLSNVSELVIVNGLVEEALSIEIIIEIVSMQRLTDLSITGYGLQRTSFACLSRLPQLSSLTLQNCQLSGKDLGCLGSSIRNIKLAYCHGLVTADLFESMRLLHTRAIPLKKLDFTCKADRTMLPVVQFVLENFAELKSLVIHEKCSSYASDALEPLRQVLPVGIEIIKIGEVDWPSISLYRQFFQALFAQPLPNLCDLLLYRETPMVDEDFSHIWSLCPKLDYIRLAGEDSMRRMIRRPRDL